MTAREQLEAARAALRKWVPPGDPAWEALIRLDAVLDGTDREPETPTATTGSALAHAVMGVIGGKHISVSADALERVLREHHWSPAVEAASEDVATTPGAGGLRLLLDVSTRQRADTWVVDVVARTASGIAMARGTSAAGLRAAMDSLGSALDSDRDVVEALESTRSGVQATER